jgi:hypothetical protein
MTILFFSVDDDNEESTNGTDDDGTKFFDDDNDIKVTYKEDNKIEHEGTQETEVSLLSSDDPPEDSKLKAAEITIDLAFWTMTIARWSTTSSVKMTMTMIVVHWRMYGSRQWRRLMIENERSKNYRHSTVMGFSMIHHQVMMTLMRN